MKRWIYLSAILLFASFLLIVLDDFNQDWKHVQKRFANIEENRFQSTPDNHSPVDFGIKQIAVEGLGRVDRCPTCHLGVSDPKYRSARAPFATHPGNILDAHKAKDFGCTACHFGQGYAVSYKEAAHKKLDYWSETMLPRALGQAACGTCHLSEDVPNATILNRGRLLIRNKGCAGCHEVSDFLVGEQLGPDLDGIGTKVARGWLYHWLQNPRSYLKNSRMPQFRFTDEEIRSLVEYLMTLNGKDAPPHPINTLPSDSGHEDRGKILVSESRCITCHSIHGRGGRFAPELERIGDKVREDWLANFLRNVHYYQPRKRMLEYNFSDQDVLDVAAYLMLEFSEEAYALPEAGAEGRAPQSAVKRQERAAAGKKLYAKYGCGGCHTIGGVGIRTKVGPKLANVGDRLESGLDFGGHDDIVPTLYNWLFMKLKQPDVFDSSNAMPNYFLTDKEAFEITVALLSNRQTNYDGKYLVHRSRRSIYKKPAGEFGKLFDRYSCISCHSIDEYGGTISTAPLTIEGSKVKFDWLRSYLMKPYALRPLLTERMPRFRMSEREASLMADYIKTVFVSDSIPRFMEYDLTQDQAHRGRALFDSMRCVNCHIFGGAGGYVGPELNKVNERLEAGWVYKWLKDPLKYKPKTIHPDFAFSDADAKALTAFLMLREGM